MGGFKCNGGTGVFAIFLILILLIFSGENNSC